MKKILKFLFFLSTFCQLLLIVTADPVGQCDPNKPDDLLADSNDCEIFYECKTGLTLKKCVQPTRFDAVRKVCDWPDLVTCAQAVTTTTTTTTTTAAPTTVDDCGDCCECKNIRQNGYFGSKCTKCRNK